MCKLAEDTCPANRAGSQEVGAKVGRAVLEQVDIVFHGGLAARGESPGTHQTRLGASDAYRMT
jgi:hypothetical protein